MNTLYIKSILATSTFPTLIVSVAFREDLSNSEAGRDVLIKKAWETRDAAVKRKNNTEIELAKTRIDVMQVRIGQFVRNIALSTEDMAMLFKMNA